MHLAGFSQVYFHTGPESGRVISVRWLIPLHVVPVISMHFDLDRKVLTYSVLWHHSKMSRAAFHDLIDPTLVDIDQSSSEDIAAWETGGLVVSLIEIRGLALRALASPLDRGIRHWNVGEPLSDRAIEQQ